MGAKMKKISNNGEEKIEKDDIISIIEQIRNSITDEDRKRYNDWEQYMKQQRIDYFISHAMIPKRYEFSELDNYLETSGNREAKNACIDFVSDFKSRSGLAIFGNIGTGKTHLAVAVCKEIIRKYLVDAKYISVLRLFDSIKEGFDSGANPMVYLKVCSLLVLDDLGVKRPSQWASEILFDLVDYRYSENLPIVITSNAGSWEGLRELISDGNNIAVERILDRLRNMVGKPVVISGKSWR